MKTFFASIIENLAWHNTYSDVMFQGSAYTYTFLALLLAPLILEAILYFLWDPIPAKLWKWIIFLPISFIIVFGIAVTLANSALVQFLNNPQWPDAGDYVIEYALWSAILSIVPFGIGIFMKLFSTNNKYNPF